MNYTKLEDPEAEQTIHTPSVQIKIIQHKSPEYIDNSSKLPAKLDLSPIRSKIKVKNCVDSIKYRILPYQIFQKRSQALLNEQDFKDRCKVVGKSILMKHLKPTNNIQSGRSNSQCRVPLPNLPLSYRSGSPVVSDLIRKPYVRKRTSYKHLNQQQYQHMEEVLKAKSFVQNFNFYR